MNKKKVLIIEDDEYQLAALQEVLEVNDFFEVYGAGRVAEARRLAELYWDELAVAVLDMRLEDPDERQTTGADIGLEFRRKKNGFPPELLIYSAYDDVDYYRLAIRLGVAAYISKIQSNILDVVQHIRVLALRHALNSENPKTASEVARIAVQCKTRPEVIMTFCRKVLKPEFEACLGTPFIFLFTEGDTTWNCADNANLPPGSNAFYHKLQALAHGTGNSAEPFIFEAGESEMASDEETALLQVKLNNAAFLPLSLSNNLRLSVGILQKQGEGEEDAKALCKVLAHYLRATVLENIMNIWSQWTELRATRTSTARLCLSVGQEIKDSLRTAKMKRLEDLADDMNDTGQLLIQLENTGRPVKGETLSLREVVTTTWELIAGPDEKTMPKLEPQGDCAIQAQRGDLELVFSRLLQWFAYRSTMTPPDAEPLIRMNFETTAEGATITFEDHSHRLPKSLREDLFVPFTQSVSTPFPRIESVQPEKSEGGPQVTKDFRNAGRYLPLYLAKILVEERYHGLLEDRSDEIEEHCYGHRILMQFPAMDEMG